MFDISLLIFVYFFLRGALDYDSLEEALTASDSMIVVKESHKDQPL